MIDSDRPARLMLISVALWALAIASAGPSAELVPGWLRVMFSVPVAVICGWCALRHTPQRVLVGLAVAAGYGTWNVLRIAITDYPPRTVIAGISANGVISVSALSLGAYVSALQERRNGGGRE